MPTPTKTGYTFTGWSGSNGSTAQTTVKIEKGSTGNKTYTANWSKDTYTITYNLNGGINASTNPTTYSFGSEISSFADPTKEGSIFAGWYSDEACTIPINSLLSTDLGNKTLFAKWRSWNRLAGGMALSTMKKVVNKGWESSEYAIIATTKGYQDALSASALAGLLGNAPILMTDPVKLSSQTSTLLVSKKIQKAIIVGGNSAVSEDVEDQIKAIVGNDNVERIAGGTATTTALEVYKYGKDINDGWGSDAIVATMDDFQDALSIAPYAYAKRMPIFLTDKGTKDVRNSVINIINNEGFNRTLVLGGLAAINDNLVPKVQQNAPVTRLAGGTAYTTSAKIANFCLENSMSSANMGVACGTVYADALAGAALCGKIGSIIVLADEKNSTTVNSIIAKQKNGLSECYIFGGIKAVSEEVENKIIEASK